jgi:hypothetical protein
MSNSAFQQRQTGNASEVGAGSVQKATPAEIAAKTDVGSSGAPLIVVPSLIPTPGKYEQYLAYEAITEGDAVGVSHFVPTTYTAYDLTDQDGSQTIDNPTVNFIAQKFTMPDVDATNLKWLTIGIHGFLGVSGSGYIEVEIRSTLNGAAILSNNQYVLFGAFNAAINVSGGELTAGQEYYFFARESASGSTGTPSIYYSNDTTIDPIVANEAWYSDNGGSSWNSMGAGVAFDMYFTSTTPWSLGHYAVFKSSAAAMDNRFGFVGYALNSAAPGEAVTIDTAGVVNIFSGLTANRKYFLSDTPGAISLTPGTLRFEVGRSSGTDTIVRGLLDESNVLLSVGIGTIIFQQAGLYYRSNSGSATFTWYDRVDLDAGELDFTRSIGYASPQDVAVRVRPGDQISSGNANGWFMPIVASR